MSREDIIRMAREAGTPYVNRHFKGQTSYGFTEESLLRFASLVAAATREQINQDEQCALKKLLEKDDYELRRHLEAVAIRALK